MVALVVAVMALLTCPNARAAFLCKTRGGAVHIRDVCRPTETQVDAATLGLQGSPGPTGPTGPQGAPGTTAVIKDSNGQLVGAINSTAADDTVVVTRSVDADHLLLIVTANGFRDVIDPPAQRYFETSDCNGQGYSDAAYGGGLFHFAAPHLGIVYYRSGPVSSRSVASRLLYGHDQASCAGVASSNVYTVSSFIPPDGCCGTFRSAFTFDVQPVASFDLTTLGLVPPFHVEGP